MKKIAIISASVMALVLSVCLFVFGVVAAFTQSFAVSNSIRLTGVGKNIIFDLDGKITGTKNDADPNLEYHWPYNYDQTTVDTANWSIGEIGFLAGTTDLNAIQIHYSFDILNKGDDGINVYFDDFDIDQYFKVITIGTLGTTLVSATPFEELYIASGETGNITLTISPLVQKYDGTRSCNFSVKIIPAD